MSMSSNDSASQDTPISTLHLSAIDVRLSKGSQKTVERITLRKNDSSFGDVPEPKCIDGVHRIDFIPPVALDPDDRVSVSVNCSWFSMSRKQVKDIPIDFNFHEIQYLRDEQGTKSYRRKIRNVEVVITGHQTLLATTAGIIQSCPRFRLLIIGNSGVGKSSLIRRAFGVEDVLTSENTRGIAHINQEFVSPTNERFVVHDSLGFEAGDQQNVGIVRDFVAQRRSMSQLKDQLHAIWLCLEIPYCGGRLLEDSAENFLRYRSDILGNIPLVVVLTKVDLLDEQLSLDLPENEAFEQYKPKFLNQHCIGPLHKAAGNDITHVTVSVQEGYSDTVSTLFRATDENMVKCHVHESQRAIASIAQRVCIQENIELSMAVGRKKYWRMLLKSAVFRGRTLEECLKVIHKDIITVWNFNDPDKYLVGGKKIFGELLRTVNPGDLSGAPSNTATLATLLAPALEVLKALSASGEITLTIAAPVAGLLVSVLQTTYIMYQEAKKDVKILMAYILDLVCIMQTLYLLTSNGRDRVTPEVVDLALRAYDGPKKIVHQFVEAFDGKLGILAGGRDYVLENIEEWLWRFSIKDHEVEKLRQKVGQVLSSCSS